MDGVNNPADARPNRRWTITVTDANHFTLNNSAADPEGLPGLPTLVNGPGGPVLPYIGGAYTEAISDNILEIMNTSPITVRTEVEHGLEAGQPVTVSGIDGGAGSGANGTFIIESVPDPFQFTLAGTVGTGGQTGPGGTTPIGRWAVPFENTPPTATGVYLAGNLPGLIPTERQDIQPILEGEQLQRGVRKIIVSFSENMAISQDGDITNPANWKLERNTDAGGAIDLDVSHFLEAPGSITFGYESRRGRYEAVLTFSQELPQGDYRLTARSGITDRVGNALDGDNDGDLGGDFVRHFSSLGTVNAPFGNIAPIEGQPIESAITDTSPIVITSPNHGVVNGQPITITGLPAGHPALGTFTASAIADGITGVAGTGGVGTPLVITDDNTPASPHAVWPARSMPTDSTP
jgi:hypothetical protein